MTLPIVEVRGCHECPFRRKRAEIWTAGYSDRVCSITGRDIGVSFQRNQAPEDCPLRSSSIRVELAGGP